MDLKNINIVGVDVLNLKILGATPMDPFVVKSASGLGPPEVEVSLANALENGGVYLGSRPQNRQIVLLTGLQPNYSAGETAATLRTKLYRALTPGVVDNLKIYLFPKKTGPSLITEGYVSKFEIAPFNKEMEVQLTIDCPKAYFWQSSDMTATNIPNGQLNLENPGTAPSGFITSFEIVTPVPQVVLTKSGININPSMTINYTFVAGDVVTIDTRSGTRGVKLLRNGVDERNLLPFVAPGSTWLSTHGGANQFNMSPSDIVWTSFTFMPQHWGI